MDPQPPRCYDPTRAEHARALLRALAQAMLDTPPASVPRSV
jgi:hypothetical protein